MTSQNRQKLLLIVAIAVIGLWAGDKLIFTPLTQSWKDRSTRIADLKKSIKNGSALLERERSIRSRWTSMETNTLPDDASVAESQVMNAFDRWSEESQIGITSIQPQWKRKDDDYMTLECRVDAFGSLQRVARFLYNIEKDPLALKVDSVEIISRDTNGMQLTLGLQVSGLMLKALDE